MCGLLGPNGAGKTTTVGNLPTLLAPDTGRAEVAGYDVVRQAAQIRHRIGLVGQHAAVDEVLSGRENPMIFGRLHHLRPAAARRRADELLEHFRLADTGGKPLKAYSPGMFVMTMVFGMGESVAAVAADKNRGVTSRFRTMPMAPSAVLVGSYVTDMLHSVLGLAVLFGVGLLMGWQAHGTTAATCPRSACSCCCASP